MRASNIAEILVSKLLDTVHHLKLKTSCFGAGSVSIFRGTGRKGEHPVVALFFTPT
jgi:hypothetical protein